MSDMLRRIKKVTEGLEELKKLPSYNDLSEEEMQFRLEKLKKMQEDTAYKIGKVEKISSPPYYVFSLGRQSNEKI